MLQPPLRCPPYPLSELRCSELSWGLTSSLATHIPQQHHAPWRAASQHPGNRPHLIYLEPMFSHLNVSSSLCSSHPCIITASHQGNHNSFLLTPHFPSIPPSFLSVKRCQSLNCILLSKCLNSSKEFTLSLATVSKSSWSGCSLLLSPDSAPVTWSYFSPCPCALQALSHWRTSTSLCLEWCLHSPHSSFKSQIQGYLLIAGSSDNVLNQAKLGFLIKLSYNNLYSIS